MKKTEPSTFDTKTLLEHILVSQVLLLSRQLRADDTVRGKVRNVGYDRKAVQIIRNAREAILFRWNYELPGQDQV
jgi:hypothetical protein